MAYVKTRVQTVAVEVIAPPRFRVAGEAVKVGKEIRLPADEAARLQTQGKCKIVPNSEGFEVLEQ